MFLYARAASERQNKSEHRRTFGKRGTLISPSLRQTSPLRLLFISAPEDSSSQGLLSCQFVPSPSPELCIYVNNCICTYAAFMLFSTNEELKRPPGSDRAGQRSSYCCCSGAQRQPESKDLWAKPGRQLRAVITLTPLMPPFITC